MTEHVKHPLQIMGSGQSRAVIFETVKSFEQYDQHSSDLEALNHGEGRENKAEEGGLKQSKAVSLSCEETGIGVSEG